MYNPLTPAARAELSPEVAAFLDDLIAILNALSRTDALAMLDFIKACLSPNDAERFEAAYALSLAGYEDAAWKIARGPTRD